MKMIARFVISLTAMAINAAIAGAQPFEMPVPHRILTLDTKGNANAQMPLHVQFSPSDSGIYTQTWLNRKEQSVNRVDVEKSTQVVLEMPKSPGRISSTFGYTFISDNSLISVSNEKLHRIVFEKDTLSDESFDLPFVKTSVMQCTMSPIHKNAVIVSRIAGNDTIESVTFNIDKKEFGLPLSYGNLAKNERDSVMINFDSELIFGTRKVKDPITYFYSVKPDDLKPNIAPLFNIVDGCISLQTIGQHYVIGSERGRLAFQSKEKNGKSVEAQVLQMCIRQVAVRKNADGTYTCLICGAAAGNSFAVAYVDVKNQTIKSQVFKIPAKNAKVLAAISNDGKTFALLDYDLRLSIYKAEQFQNLVK